MSLVSGFPHHPVMHHHDSHHYSLHAAAAAAGRCHEDTGAPPYFTSWLISHAEMSPTEYSLAPGYSPEYGGGGGGGGSAAAQDSHHHHHHHHYGPGGGLLPAAGTLSVNGAPVGMHHHAHPRTVKRRPTANRKERRRTQSINSAFAELRECIPNVPADTKLSKIKTLRLATSYISYLMELLDKDAAHGDTHAFKAELKKSEARDRDRDRERERDRERDRDRDERRKREPVETPKAASSLSSSSSSSSSSASLGDKKTKGRTGWPQHVWALELKQ